MKVGGGARGGEGRREEGGTYGGLALWRGGAGTGGMGKGRRRGGAGRGGDGSVARVGGAGGRATALSLSPSLSLSPCLVRLVVDNGCVCANCGRKG